MSERDPWLIRLHISHVILSLGLVVSSMVAQADPAQPTDEVVVESRPHPEAKRYANLLRGTQIFAQYRQFAPQASLRFKLYPREAGVNMHNLKVQIVSKSVRIPLELDNELRFELPVNQTAVEENADLIYNRQEGTLGWRVDVRTPGIPENMRRLGDLRLECRVELFGAHVARTFGSLGVISKLSNPCTNPEAAYHFIADRPIFNVTLTYGNRSDSLPTEKLYGNDWSELMMGLVDWVLLRDRVFLAPLSDTTWPDDTLLEFDYMDDTPALGKAP
jgi:hypothetical protein